MSAVLWETNPQMCEYAEHGHSPGCLFSFPDREESSMNYGYTVDLRPNGKSD